jgi:CheY-like chemotaxis protein
MIGPGHILVVDDDPAFLRMYREIFEDEGLQVSTATSVAQAITALDAHGPSLDVVVIDQKMHGPSGPDSVLSLLAEVGVRAPFALPIIATGYAPPSAAARAFDAGVYDYIVKNIAFETLVRAKVKNAVKLTEAERRLAMTADSVTLELRALWLQVRGETDHHRKGKLLETLVRLLFQVTPGFGRVLTRLTNGVEAIDIVVENQATAPPWKDEGAYLVGECKRWSSACGIAELRDFCRKLTAKYQRARIGVLIAPGGFAPEVREDIRSHKEGELLLILIDDADLERWVTADDRLAVLCSFHERAVFDLKLS